MIEVYFNSESDVKPDKFNIENILNGKCDIVLYDNIRKYSKEDENNNLRTYYLFDIYRIVKHNYRDNLEIDLKDKFEIWLDFAKEQYKNQAEKVSIEERLSTAEAVISEILGGDV